MKSAEAAPAGLRLLLLRAAVGLVKRRALLAGLCLAAGVLAFRAAPRLPRSYVSTAVVQLRKSLATATSENAGLEATETDGKITEDYREVQTGLLSSDLLRRAVAARLLEAGLPAPDSLPGRLRELAGRAPPAPVPGDPAALDACAEWLAGALTVQRAHKAPLVTVSLRHSSADAAREALALLLDEYGLALRRLYDIDPVLRAAEDQARAAEAVLGTRRLALEEFEAREGLEDPAGQLEAARRQAVQLEEELALREAALVAARERAAALERGVAGLPSGFAAEPTRLENKRRVALLNLLEGARRRLIESPFVEGSPEHAALREPVAQLEAELDEEPAFLVEQNPQLPNAAFAQYESDLRAAQAEVLALGAAVEALQARVGACRRELARLDAAADGHALLQREVQRAEAEADERVAQAGRVRRVKDMQDAEQLWSFRLIQEPSRATRPESPGRTLSLLLLLAAGLLLALAATLVAGLVDPSVASAADAEAATGAPPLACLPECSTRGQVRAVLARLGLAASQAVAPSRRPGPRLFGELGPAGRLYEARLDGLLRAAAPEGGAALLVVCGTHSGSGASTVAANLAARLARRGMPVRLLAAAPGSGPSPAELQAARAAGSVLVVDARPVLEDAATLDLCARADAVLLVARGDVTRRIALREAATQLLAVSTGRVGVVLNGLRLRLPACLQPV